MLADVPRDRELRFALISMAGVVAITLFSHYGLGLDGSATGSVFLISGLAAGGVRRVAFRSSLGTRHRRRGGPQNM